MKPSTEIARPATARPFGPARILRSMRRALAAPALAVLAGMPAAQAATVSAVSSRVSIEHSAALRVDDIRYYEVKTWDPVESMTLADPVRATTMLPYTSNVDTRLTMTHEAVAAGRIVKGLTFDGVLSGPRLKVETRDSMLFDGNGFHNNSEGVAWRHTRSELAADALMSFDLSILTAGPLPDSVVFFWRIDGSVEFDLFAPSSLAGSDNWLSVAAAPQMTSTLAFAYGQVTPDCAFCIDRREFEFGLRNTSLSGEHPRYSRTSLLPPQVIAAVFDVHGDPTLLNLSFGLGVESVHELWNMEFANQLLEATIHANFGNSAVLLGVQARDADGLEMTGVSYLASDPELLIPVYSGIPAVPEPGSAALMLAGLLAAGTALRRRRD